MLSDHEQQQLQQQQEQKLPIVSETSTTSAVASSSSSSSAATVASTTSTASTTATSTTLVAKGIDPKFIRQIQEEKMELDAMFARRRGVTFAPHPKTLSAHSSAPNATVPVMGDSSPSTSLFASNDNYNLHKKRRIATATSTTTASFHASMNFQETAPKRFKTMPKKPEEGRITWSNVYDAPPLTEVPKIKFDDTARGPLLIVTNSISTIPKTATSSSSTSTATPVSQNNNDNNDVVPMNDNERTLAEHVESGVESWKEFEAAMTESTRSDKSDDDHLDSPVVDDDDDDDDDAVAAATLGDTRGDIEELDQVKDDVEDIDVDESP
ncbi:hypothetical protein MHU86_24500 [Fragilaria crotonensis]|nr:hypothetical protein MHU86_24500 [Fragilaria crotonensis]